MGDKTGRLTDLLTLVHGRRWYARVAQGGRGGARLPVVLVHGFGISSAYFVPAAERLAADFDVYAPDLPGHGKSHTPPRALDVPQLAAALADWLRVLRIERAAFVANSMGCQTAAELAVGQPALVERLALIGPTVDRQARRLLKLVPRFVAGGAHERLSMTPLLARDYLRMGWRLRAELGYMLADRIEEKMPHVRAPVLLIRGQYDHIAPRRWLAELARAAPNASVAEVAGGGHAAHYGAVDALMPVLVPFLESATPSAGAEPLAAAGDEAGGLRVT